MGLLHARDLLLLVGQENAPTTIRELVRPAIFVPESKRLDELLYEITKDGAQMTVAVDEYGGTAGLVTLTDVLEEIVGESVDAFERQEPEIQVVDENRLLLDALVNLDYLEEQFGVQIMPDGFDTVGG